MALLHKHYRNLVSTFPSETQNCLQKSFSSRLGQLAAALLPTPIPLVVTFPPLAGLTHSPTRQSPSPLTLQWLEEALIALSLRTLRMAIQSNLFERAASLYPRYANRAARHYSLLNS
jgi:hypothetical protein